MDKQTRHFKLYSLTHVILSIWLLYCSFVRLYVLWRSSLLVFLRGRWNRETWQLGIISQGWTSRDWTTQHQIKQTATVWASVDSRKKLNVLND